MAESFVEKRRRELGLSPLTTSNITQATATKTVEKPKESDFVTRRKMELGLTPDTRKADAAKKLSDSYAASKQEKDQFGNAKWPFTLLPEAKSETPEEKGGWNGIIDNPVTHALGTGLSWAQKPFEALSVIGADTVGQTRNLFGTKTRIGMDGKEIITTPSESRDLGKDLKNIFTKTHENVSSDAWKGALPNLNKLPGTSVNATDAIDFGAQFVSPTKFIAPAIKGIRAVSELSKASKVEKSFDEMFSIYDQAAKNRNVLDAGVIDRGEAAIMDRVNTIDQITNRNKTNPLQLAEPKSAVMARELEKRSVLPANTDVIHGRGNVPTPETLGLPQGQYTPPTRLKINNPTETLDYVMTKIKPQVMDIIEAPERRDLLVKYIQKNTGYEFKDIVNRPMNELQELGQVIQDDLHSNMKQIAFDVAKQHGHDLPALLERQAPDIRTQLAKDTQSQVYGVQPPKIGIQKPDFNITHNADAAMPITKVGRAPTLKEVAANPKVDPIKGTVNKTDTVKPPVSKVEVINRPNPLKVKAEVKSTRTPDRKVAGIRANYQNQLKNGNLSPELKKRIGNTDKTYEKVTNEDSVNKANTAIQDLTGAESKFIGNKEYSAEHVATGYRLIQELDKKAAAETNTVLKETFHQRSLNVANKLAKDLTEAGQTVQAANVIAKLSPEGQLLNLTRQAEKNGKVVSVADKVKFQELAVKVQNNSGAGARSNQFTEILDRAAKGEKLTPDDVKNMSDYLANAEKSLRPKVVKVIDDLPEELKVPRKRERIISYLDDAEQAALARIKSRKSTLNAGVPIGEWKDHAIVVAAQLTKGSIKAATHVEDLVKLFGEEIRPVASQVFQKAQSLVKSIAPGIGSNDMTKANKAFERISGQAKEVNFQEKIVEKYLKENPKVSPKDIDTLRELAKNITRLSSDDKIIADIAMQKILNSYEKSTPWDKVKAIRYMAMLLNSGTQLVNAASGPIMATTGHVADIFGTMLDQAMHVALKTPRTTTMYGANPLRFMADYTKNLLKVGMPSGWHGVNPAGIQNVGEIRGLTFKSNYNPLNWAERTLGAVAKGTDYAAYKTVYDSEIRKVGFLEALNSGIKRSDKAAIKSYVEKFVNEPTEAAMLQADRIGKNTTFQRSDSIGGSTANFLNSGNEKVKKYVSPVVNAVVPFVKTPINIASTAVTMTPAGILKGLWQLTSKSPASQREAIRTLSLSLTGSAGIGSLGYYLSQLGIITGANDSGDKNVDAIREQAGKGKYRFNTSALKRYLNAWLSGEGADGAEKAAKYQEGDHAFDYNRFQPLAFPLATGASLQENKSKPLLGRLESAGTDAYGSLFGMSTLKGVQDVFQPQYSGTQGEKQIGVASRLAESFFKSFSPSMLAQETRRQDPIARKTPYNNGLKEDVKGYFQSRTPGLSQSLPANKTTLGLNKMNAAGFTGQYINPYKSEIAAYSKAAVIITDLIDRTGDAALAPSVPEKKVSGKDKKTGEQVEYAIPKDRYEQLQEEIGHNIILQITALDPNMKDADKVEKIKDIYSKVRKKEMNKVKTELGIKIPW